MLGRRRILGLGLAALASVGLAGRLNDAAHAQDGGTGHLHGRILGDDGAPLADAHVTIVSPELPDGDASLTTDADGRFTLGPVPVGLYDVSAERDGYGWGSLTMLQVNEGQTTEVEITLPKRGSGY